MSAQNNQLLNDFKDLINIWKDQPSSLKILDITSLTGMLAFIVLIVIVYEENIKQSPGNMSIVILPALLAGITAFARMKITEKPETKISVLKDSFIISLIFILLAAFVVFVYNV